MHKKQFKSQVFLTFEISIQIHGFFMTKIVTIVEEDYQSTKSPNVFDSQLHMTLSFG